MNNSIAIIRNCQRNWLRKSANNADSLPDAVGNYIRSRIGQNINPIFQRDLEQLSQSEDAQKIVSDAYERMVRADTKSDNTAQHFKNLRRYTLLEQAKAYAPWTLGSAVVGGGLGGWIGSKYDRTLLGILLGGVGGYALGGIGKGLYEKYAKGDRYGKALRGVEALGRIAEANQPKQS